MAERTLRANKACAEWLAYCLRLGWSRDHLDALEALWWEHHDERGNLIPTDGVQAVAPTLPQSLLDLIGDYGMARTDGVSDVERLHRWQLLIDGIKAYALGVQAAVTDRALMQQTLGTINALLEDMEGQGSWTQIDDDLLPELQARQRELMAALAAGVPGMPFDRAAVFTIWQGMQYQGGITTEAQAVQFAQQVLSAHGVDTSDGGQR